MFHQKFQSLNQTVRVESLEDFVRSEYTGLKVFFTKFNEYLNQYTYYDYEGQLSVLKGDQVKDFIAAARLNPNMKITYMKRAKHLAPGDETLTQKQVTYLPSIYRGEPQLYHYVKTPKEVVIKRILETYCDEPDWGLDNDLWLIQSYGYGKAPLGVRTGGASLGLFHTNYSDEALVVRTFASAVTQTRMPERIELFWRLALFANETGHQYWAYRFAAWALHYLQDLAQPYHARAIPRVRLFEAVNYIFSFGIFGDNKDQIKRKNALKLMNRHYVFEQVSALLLDRQNKETYSIVTLANSFDYRPANAIELMYEVARYSRNNILKIDDFMTEKLPGEIGKNDRYSLPHSKTFISSDSFDALPARQKTDFTNISMNQLSYAARVTEVYIGLLEKQFSQKKASTR